MAVGNLTFLNGKFMDSEQAFISIEDRGFQFGDGIYEVIRCYNGRPFGLAEHLDRLIRSAAGLKLEVPYSKEEITGIIDKLLVDSGLEYADVYIQVTRGKASRIHHFPKDAKSTFVSYIKEAKPLPPTVREKGIKCIIVPDNRWHLCHIKSVNLLPNVLARQAAEEAGANEGLFEREGVGVIEGSASNLFIVDNGTLITGPDSNLTLGGITRDYILRLAKAAGIPVELRFVSRAELLDADEVFVTSTTREVQGVVAIGEHTIAGGTVGNMTADITRRFFQAVEEQCGPLVFE